MFKKLLNYFYPERCPYCNCVIKQEEIACPKCLSKFPQNGFICYARGGYKCACAFLYDGIFSKAIKRLKFNNKPQYAPLLAQPLTTEITNRFSDIAFDMVTSVPLHKNGIKTRGYNQAELVAKSVAKLLGVPYVKTLVKVKDNAKQHTLSRNMRASNVKNVYKFTGKTTISGKNVLLCDDIITTGSTLGECARILQKNAPASIYCAAVCMVIQK